MGNTQSLRDAEPEAAREGLMAGLHNNVNKTRDPRHYEAAETLLLLRYGPVIGTASDRRQGEKEHLRTTADNDQPEENSASQPVQPSKSSSDPSSSQEISGTTKHAHKRADMIESLGRNNPKGRCDKCEKAGVERCLVPDDGGRMCAYCTRSKSSKANCNMEEPKPENDNPAGTDDGEIKGKKRKRGNNNDSGLGGEDREEKRNKSAKKK